MKSKAMKYFLPFLTIFILITGGIPIMSINSIGVNPSESDDPKILSMNISENVTILENGSAQISILMDIPSSPLAEMYRKGLGAPFNATPGEAIEIPTSMPLPTHTELGENVSPDNLNFSETTINVREIFYNSVCREQKYSLGLITSISNSSMIPRGSNDEFKINLNGYSKLPIFNITKLGYKDYIWKINIGPLNLNSATSLTFAKIGFIKQMLESLPGEQKYKSNWTTTFILPENGTLLNGGAIEGLNWSINFGNGTLLYSSLRVENSKIILLEQMVVTENNKTVPLDQLYENFSDYKSFKINCSTSAFPTDVEPELYSWWGEWGTSWYWKVSLFDFSYATQFGNGDGNLYVNGGIDLEGYIGAEWLIVLTSFEAWVKPGFHGEVDVEFNGAIAWEHTWSWKIFEKSWDYTFFIGWIQVYTTIRCTVTTEIEVNIEGELDVTAGVSANGFLKAGAKWTIWQGWQKINEHGINFNHDFSLEKCEIGASLRPSLTPRVAVLFYEVAGPFLEVEGYGLINAKNLLSPSNVKWSVKAGINVNAGITYGWLLKWLGLPEFKWTLFNVEYEIWSYKDYRIRPDNPLVKNITEQNCITPLHENIDKNIKILYNWVKENISYRSDVDEWGEDYWQLPSTTIGKGSGDGEDQAILLTSLLRAADISPDHVRMVYGKIGFIFPFFGFNHSWVEIKPDDSWNLTSNHSKEDIDEFIGETAIIKTEVIDLPINYTQDRIDKVKSQGRKEKKGWIPLDTSYILLKESLPFWMWGTFGYNNYFPYNAKPIDFYTDLRVAEMSLAGKVKVEKDLYYPHKQVNFTFTNTGCDEIMLPNTAPWRIEREDYGMWKSVYAPIALQVIIPLGPGESLNWSWNQTIFDNNSAGSGHYRIVVNYYEGGCLVNVSDEFWIIKPIDKEVDLEARSISFSDSFPIEGEKIEIRTYVACHGKIPENATASFYVDGEKIGETKAEYWIVPISYPLMNIGKLKEIYSINWTDWMKIDQPIGITQPVIHFVENWIDVNKTYPFLNLTKIERDWNWSYLIGNTTEIEWNNGTITIPVVNFTQFSTLDYIYQIANLTGNWINISNWWNFSDGFVIVENLTIENLDFSFINESGINISNGVNVSYPVFNYSDVNWNITEFPAIGCFEVNWIAKKGEHLVEIFVDPENRINENREDNNYLSKEIEVSPVPVPPVASFDHYPKYPRKNQNITFDASKSFSWIGSIELYEWDWNNDGIYDNAYQYPITTHSWEEDGTYSVTLRVTGSNGLSDTVTHKIYVGAFYFIHLTDTHIGAKGAIGRLKGMIDHINSLEPQPAFVIITGDLVDWGCWESGEENYIDFLDCVNDLNVPYYCCPGNHDYRWCSSLESYHQYITNADNYSFVYSNLSLSTTHFISLNSGWDVYEDYWFWLPEGSGLSNKQIGWFENILKNSTNSNKIVFMHHPAINYHDGIIFDWWDDGTIANNRELFKSLCLDYGVDAVLCGHTHRNKIYRASDDHNNPQDILPPVECYTTMFVQTAACKDLFYRKIAIQGDNVKIEEPSIVKPSYRIIIYGNATLHAYDRYGNHVGINKTGGFDFQIKDAYYSNYTIDNHTMQVISLPYRPHNYTIFAKGVENDTISMEVARYTKDGSSLWEFENISLTNTSRIKASIHEQNCTLQLDDNADNIIDSELMPILFIDNEKPKITNISVNPVSFVNISAKLEDKAPKNVNLSFTYQNKPLAMLKMMKSDGDAFYYNCTPPFAGLYSYSFEAEDENGNKNVTCIQYVIVKENQTLLDADEIDTAFMMQASVGDIQSDERFDLDGNGEQADAVDVTMMLQASVGDIDLASISTWRQVGYDGTCNNWVKYTVSGNLSLEELEATVDGNIAAIQTSPPTGWGNATGSISAGDTIWIYSPGSCQPGSIVAFIYIPSNSVIFSVEITYAGETNVALSLGQVDHGNSAGDHGYVEYRVYSASGNPKWSDLEVSIADGDASFTSNCNGSPVVNNEIDAGDTIYVYTDNTNYTDPDSIVGQKVTITYAACDVVLFSADVTYA